MNDPTPHYLLISEANRGQGLGHWRFTLRSIDGKIAIEVADVEPDTWGQRLDLLTVIRGLESLEQPSRVTLIGCSRYVEQGIQYGLAEWRDNNWRWEYFGQMTQVRDADLWQRMDRILQFHRVECGQRRFDFAHTMEPCHHWNVTKLGKNWLDGLNKAKWVKYAMPILAAWCGVCLELTSRLCLKIVGLGLHKTGSGI
jgi:ribonuclease HI